MKTFANIILPLALDRTFTYEIPEDLREGIIEGSRVEVQFGKRRIYAGIVKSFSDEKPQYKTKPVLSLLDDNALVNDKQLSFWVWMANYYMCSLGEVMLAGLPSALKLASETVVVRNEDTNPDAEKHSDDEYLILEALEFQNELSIVQIEQILDKKTVFPVVNRMLRKNLISTKEEVQNKYKPKVVTVLKWHPEFENDAGKAIQIVEKYDRQVDSLLTFIQLNKTHDYVTKANLQKKANVSYSTIKSLVTKEILLEEDAVISRLGDLSLSDKTEHLPELNIEQERALAEVKQHLQDKRATLLHGVTGSGKTRIYIELIKESIAAGKQVLYLLPEIALTTHFINRLKHSFGDAVTTYHSRMNPNQRAEVYKRAQHEIQLLVGPRSALFLPFENLGLIIVDESHDYSFKQQDPAPRYHGRDAAVVLAGLHDARVIMGTATPSIETYFNAKTGKYGYVQLPHRVKELNPPEISVYALNKLPSGEMVESFSKHLLAEIKKNYDEGRQCLIFRNRRGYAPVLKCSVCGWYAECIHCDVALTYHKAGDSMHCHYCGYRTPVSKSCPTCGNTKLQLKGSGTEKLEETLQLLMPDARIDRLDADTASGAARMGKIMHQFESGETDVLIGTQMITKGLDFENVGLVGVILADALLYFPDFRSEERAHQILKQVAGRAGRAYDQSKVIIQTYQPKHPVFKSLNWEGQMKFLHRILKERKSFIYPPYIRFVRVQFFHRDADTVARCSAYFKDKFTSNSDLIVLGPVPNPVKRIRSRYIMNCIIKIRKTERDRRALSNGYRMIKEELNAQKWSRGLRMTINVDPY